MANFKILARSIAGGAALLSVVVLSVPIIIESTKNNQELNKLEIINGISAKTNPSDVLESDTANTPTLSIVQKAFDGVNEENFANLEASWKDGTNSTKIIELKTKTGYVFEDQSTTKKSKEIKITKIINGISAKTNPSDVLESEVANTPTLSVVQKAFDGVNSSNFINLEASWKDGTNSTKIIDLKTKSGFVFEDQSTLKESKEIKVTKIINGISAKTNPSDVLESEVANTPTLSVVQKAFDGVNSSNFINLEASWKDGTNSTKIIELKTKTGFVFEDQSTTKNSNEIRITKIISGISAKNNPSEVYDTDLSNPPTLSIVQKAFDGVNSSNFINLEASWKDGTNSTKIIELKTKTGFVFEDQNTIKNSISIYVTLFIKNITIKENPDPILESDLAEIPSFSVVQKAFNGIT
ncbi:MAG: hypothetical protein ACRCRZ_01905 [Metamycoplasmataceae bacterium]